MTTITASYTIIPNEATPKRRLWMSASDHIVPSTHSPTIYIYKGNHNTQNVIKRLRDSLSKILVYYYPLAGRLCWIGGGRHELDCNAKGALLLEAESTKTLADYGDFSPKEPIQELFPIVDYTQPIEEIPLLLVQVTKFQDGLAIGASISHPLVDGVAAIAFFNTWAKLCRGDPLDPHEISPFVDRTILKFSPNPPIFDHQEFKPMPFLLGKTNATEERKKETTISLLKLTLEQVEKLKKRANDQLKVGFRPYSRYEVIAAHLWRCASMARQLDDHQQSVVRIPVDIRKRLNPPLPSNYFGNALLPTFTPKCHIREIISNPINYVAQKLREAINTLTNEYIRSQINFLRDQEQIDSIRVCENVKDSQKDVPFHGNPNLHIVSWMSMPVYEADFGWGKPMYFGPGSLGSDGKVYIVQSSQGDGSVVILIRLQIEHMQIFSKLFYKDI